MPTLVWSYLTWHFLFGIHGFFWGEEKKPTSKCHGRRGTGAS